MVKNGENRIKMTKNEEKMEKILENNIKKLQITPTTCISQFALFLLLIIITNSPGELRTANARAGKREEGKRKRKGRRKEEKETRGARGAGSPVEK